MTAPVATRAWCHHLRWKGYALDQTSPARVLQVLHHGGCMFTCGRTTQSAGWDDRLAAPEACTPSRECYVPHPLLDTLRA